MKQPFILRSSIRLDRLFQTYRDNPALIASGVTKSFAEIEEILHIVVTNLKDAGIRKGNLVALHGSNSELHLYLFLASWIMDFLYIPLDFKAPVLSLLSDTPIDFLVTDDRTPAVAKYIIIHPEKVMAPPL